jgi:hypothetical protein
MGMWNLERFLVCFLNKVPKEALEKILSSYPETFEKEFIPFTVEFSEWRSGG